MITVEVGTNGLSVQGQFINMKCDFDRHEPVTVVLPNGMEVILKSSVKKAPHKVANAFEIPRLEYKPDAATITTPRVKAIKRNGKKILTSERFEQVYLLVVDGNGTFKTLRSKLSNYSDGALRAHMRMMKVRYEEQGKEFPVLRSLKNGKGPRKEAK